MKRRLTNNSGFALISVILAITIISVLGTSVVGVTLNSVKTSFTERDDQAIFYIAEAGLTVEVEKMKLRAEEIYENKGLLNISSCDNDLECIENLRVTAAEDFFTELQSVEELIIENNDFENVTNGKIKPKAEVKVKQLSDIETPYSREYMITSEGFIDDKSRTVEQLVAFTWPGVDQSITLTPDDSNDTIENLPKGTAAYVKEGITHNGGTVKGNIGSLKCNTVEKVVKITNGGSYVVGDIYLPEHCVDRSIDAPQYMFDEGRFSKFAKPSTVSNIPNLPSFPLVPEYTKPKDKIVGDNGGFKVINDGNLNITDYRVSDYTLDMSTESGNLQFGEVKIVSDYKLRINVGDKDRNLVVDTLDIPQGSIQIVGSGTLNIYVKNVFTIGGGSKINEGGNRERLNVFYRGNKSVNFGGAQKLNGSIYLSEANMTIGNSAKLTGNIFIGGNSLIISGHADAESQIILAPNAHVSIDNSGKVIGAVFANSLHLSGGGDRIVFEEGWIDEGPISPPKPEPEEPETSNEPLDIDKYINKNPVSEV